MIKNRRTLYILRFADVQPIVLHDTFPFASMFYMLCKRIMKTLTKQSPIAWTTHLEMANE